MYHAKLMMTISWMIDHPPITGQPKPYSSAFSFYCTNPQHGNPDSRESNSVANQKDSNIREWAFPMTYIWWPLVYSTGCSGEGLTVLFIKKNTIYITQLNTITSVNIVVPRNNSTSRNIWNSTCIKSISKHFVTLKTVQSWCKRATQWYKSSALTIDQ